MASNNDNDRADHPAGLLHSVVKIANTARQDLNGQLGSTVSYNAERGRYMVSLLTAPPQMLALKPDNLVAASFTEKARHRMAETRHHATRLLHDPRLRRQAQAAYDAAQRALPAKVKPEYVMAVLVAGFMVCVATFGVSKTLLFCSLLALPVMTCAPDMLQQWQSGRGLDAKAVVRQFPKRWHELVVQSTGTTRISERMALGGFVLLMLFSGKILLTPVPVRGARPPVTSVPTEGSSTGSKPVSSVMSYGSRSNNSMEDIYKLGFNDATEGHPYGHSLPTKDVLDVVPPPAAPYDTGDDLDWSYQPPPTTSGSSKFGVTTMMAMFTLLRTGKELGTGPDGRLSPESFLTNARTMDPLRMGLTGLALYKVVTTFLF